MDSKQLPNDGSEMAGLTFGEAFVKCPKIVEFVRCLWVESGCEGIYLDFYQYCMGMLNNPMVLEEHKARCKKYVKSCKDVVTASYLKKYL